VVDQQGRRWNLSNGHCEDASVAPLTPIGLRLADAKRWRSRNPDNEVYLVTALENATDHLLDAGADGWRFHDGGNPPNDWAAPEFDDSGWPSGKAPLGYGQSGVVTTLSFGDDASNKTPSACFRHTVDVPEPRKLARLVGRIQCDDGAVVYLNGREVYRENMPAGPITPKVFAAGKGEADGWEVFFIAPNILQAGTNVFAVRVHQADPASSDLYLDLQISKLAKKARDPE